MRRYFKQALRGMGYLPHVGSHPGTGFTIIMALGTMVTGWFLHGFWGMMAGAALFLVSFGPIYVHSSVSRANLCDMLSGVKRP